MLLIGLVSGTSADGIDAALVEIEGEARHTRLRLIHALCLPHPDEMRRAILAACAEGGAGASHICALNSALGESFADAALAVAREAGMPIARVDGIASHGQTVWHQPKPIEI